MSNSSLNVEKCPFVAGEVYKTRDGRDAECIALRPRAGHVIFAIQDETGEYSGSWPLNGIIYPDTESCDDILPPAPKGFGLACTVAWTELATAMRKDGHAVNDSSGPNTRAWIENIVRDVLTAPAAPAAVVVEAIAPKLVERWVVVLHGRWVYSNLYVSEEQARESYPSAHSYHKIMVPE